MTKRSFLAVAILVASGFLEFVVPANASTVFDFSYIALDGTFSGSGQFIATGQSPTFQVIDVTGTALTGNAGSAIEGISSFASADNLLNFPAQPYTDFFGISFHTAADGDFNLYFNSLEFTGQGVIRQSIDPTGMSAGTQVALSVFEVSSSVATPILGTLPLLLSGLVVICGMAWAAKGSASRAKIGA